MHSLKNTVNYIKNTLLGGIGALAISGAVLSVLAPLVVYGQGTTPNFPGVPTNTTVNDFITKVICVIASYMLWIMIALAVVFTLIAAYKYLFSGGDSAKISEATKTITYAALAIAVGLVAKSLPFIVGSVILNSFGMTFGQGPFC